MSSNQPEIKNNQVIIKVDYNLSNLEDINRVTASLPTINHYLQNNNILILVTHWGRPKGKLVPELSTKQILPILQKELGIDTKIIFVNQFESFLAAQEIITKAESKTIFLLENTRFDSREESEDEVIRLELAKKYANLGSFLVDEAFSLSHRQEATNCELKQILPNTLGLNFQKEVAVLTSLNQNPSRPYYVIMSGAKLETKLPLIQKILPKVDKLLVGGKLCFTFLQAAKELYKETNSQIYSKYQDVDLYNSSQDIETEFLPEAKLLLQDYTDKIFLPVDFTYFEDKTENKKFAFDVGPQTVSQYVSLLQDCQTLFWNGTLGYYEKPPFDKATTDIAKAILELPNCYKVVGGGDTVSALSEETLAGFDFVSTGGGATLEFLARV